MNSKYNIVIMLNKTFIAKDILIYAEEMEPIIDTNNTQVNQIRSSDFWAIGVMHRIELPIFIDNETRITDVKNKI
jgi:hypothetical protein